jgi:hypothetical protein
MKHCKFFLSWFPSFNLQVIFSSFRNCPGLCCLLHVAMLLIIIGLSHKNRIIPFTSWTSCINVGNYFFLTRLYAVLSSFITMEIIPKLCTALLYFATTHADVLNCLCKLAYFLTSCPYVSYWFPWAIKYASVLSAHTANVPNMPVVFIHCPYSNPHPPQIGRVWVENNYPLKKWGG